MKRNENKVEVNNEPEVIQNWRLDQIVASDLFDLESARPIETERLMTEKQAILAKHDKTSKNLRRVKEIDEQLGNIPYQDVAQDILLKIAKIIEKQNDKTK